MFLTSILLCFISYALCISNNEILLHMEKNASWIFYEEHEGIKIYIYENEELPIIKIEKELDPSITKNQIFETILNLENYNNILTDKNLYSEFVTTISDTIFGYQKTKNYIPFIRNRHLIFKLYQLSKNRLEWTILDKNNQLYDKFKHRRNKELQMGAGAWEFLKLSDTSYLIHYLYIVPDINIPNFILNKIRRNSAKSVMQDVINYIELNNHK